MKENKEKIITDENLSEEELKEIELENTDEEELKKEEQTKQSEEENKEPKKKDDDKEKKQPKTKTVTKKEVIREKTKDKNDKDKKKDKEKKNNKNDTRPMNVTTTITKSRTPFLLWILVIIVFCLVTAAGVFYYAESQKEVEFDNEWEEKYYKFLENGIIKKGKDEEGNEIKGSLVYKEKNPQLYMLEIPSVDNPIMITESSGYKSKYQTNNKNVDKIITIHSINNIGNVEYKMHIGIDDLVFLYNIEQDEYGWYLHNEEKDINTYKSVEDIVISDSNVREYRYEKEEDFKQAFIKVNVSIKKQRIGDNISENRLKNIVKKASSEMKYQDELLTDKVLENIEKQLDKLSEIEDEETEEVEDTEKLDTTNTLKVGDYIITYGKYLNDTIELTLNSDGSCKYKSSDIYSNCTFNIENDDYEYKLVITVDGQDAVLYYIVKGNNKFDDFIYQE